MKLKYHLDLENEGLVILESEPQMRSLITYSACRNSTRIALPYLQFAIRYCKIKGKFHYPGVYGSGLRVTGSFAPLSSDKMAVFFLPVGDVSGGRVCTPHEVDMKGFNSLNELVNSVVSMWFGVTHQICCREWASTKLEDLNKLTWTKDLYSYSKALGVGKGSWSIYFDSYKDVPNAYGFPSVPTFDIKLPATLIMTDEQWGPNVQLKETITKSFLLEVEKTQINIRQASLALRKERRKERRKNRRKQRQ